MDDTCPVDGPAQDAVPPHKLDLRGLTLEPQAKIVKVLVEPSWLQRVRARSAQVCHGPST